MKDADQDIDAKEAADEDTNNDASLEADFLRDGEAEEETEEFAEEEDYSLDDLGAAYARALVESGILPAPSEEMPAGGSDAADSADHDEHLSVSVDGGEEDTGGVSPLGIVEAALFIGHPENKPLTAAQIAATMRGVSAAEVDQLVEELNAIYQNNGHAFNVIERDGGYVFGLSEQMRSVRSAFYGKIRETRLNQAAIDVLALVAYQPGITSPKISDQRGKDSGPIINQMVRRELLEVRREQQNNGKSVPTYYPTVRLLNLLGLGGLDDLPQVDEADISQRDF